MAAEQLIDEDELLTTLGDHDPGHFSERLGHPPATEGGPRDLDVVDRRRSESLGDLRSPGGSVKEKDPDDEDPASLAALRNG